MSDPLTDERLAEAREVAEEVLRAYESRLIYEVYEERRKPHVLILAEAVVALAKETR